MRTLIRGGTLVDEKGAHRADLLTEDAHIAAIGEDISIDGATVIDAAGCLVFPGFIDPHTHFDLDVGSAVTADDFATGTAAALLGGTTTILDFATQDRGQTMQKALQDWHAKAASSSCHYGFHMALSEWNEALHNELADMPKAGVTSCKLYMVYPNLRVDDGAFYHALRRAKELGVLIGAHCENFDLLQALIAAEHAAGHFGPDAHPRSRPAIVEAEAVSRFLRIAELAGAPAYVVHLSTAEGLREAQRARKRGQRVYLETCPQYLLLTDDCYAAADAAKFVMSPPLRKSKDMESLWQGLQKDAIQTVGTDHCSFTMAQKALGKEDFTQIPNGGAGVQVRAALYYTYGVQRGIVTPEQMAAQLSANAAKVFGMYPQKGALQIGSDADIVIWDPNHRETITHTALRHNCDNTPYEGVEVSGRVRDVLLAGAWAVQNGALAMPGLGRYVRRGPSGAAMLEGV